MEEEAKQSAGVLQLQAWLEQNKKRILMVCGGVLVAVLALVVYVNLQTQRESSAAQALSEIRTDRQPDGTIPPGLGEAYLKVANDYQGTKAAAQALLLAAGTYYVQGNYAESQARFEEFLNKYPDSPFVSQALLGVASNYDAQKNNQLAIAKYEEVRRVYPNQPASESAYLSLARLYEAEDRFEDAYAIYEEIMATQTGSGMASEAGMKLEDLKERHPELVKTNAPSTAALTNPLTLGTNQSAVSNSLLNAVTNAAKAVSTNLPIEIDVSTPTAPAPTVPVPTPAPAPDPNPAP